MMRVSAVTVWSAHLVWRFVPLMAWVQAGLLPGSSLLLAVRPTGFNGACLAAASK